MCIVIDLLAMRFTVSVRHNPGCFSPGLFSYSVGVG